VDARDGAAFAAGHVQGSLNSPLEGSFGSYVGWVVPFDTRIVLVADGPHDRAEATLQLFRIGYDRVVGYLDGGVDAWAGSGCPLATYPLATLEELVSEARGGGGRVLDVRQRREWDTGHLEGSRHCFVGDLPTRLHELGAAGELLVACASGHRSAIAASLLDAAGIPVRLLARGGVPDAMRALG
jgi:rhodanese-related sulfurtransferase